MIEKKFPKISQKEKLKERISFFLNYSQEHPKLQKTDSNSSLPKNSNEDTIPKNSFRVQKLFQNNSSKLGIKIKNFKKISPKFDIINNQKENTNNENIESLYNSVSESDIEMLQIEENISIKNMEQIELKTINYNKIGNNFPFHFLIEIEKCYQEMSKDLKGNGVKNLEYKKHIAANYLNIVLNKENIIYKHFVSNKDFNKFFIIEFCVFFTILFLDDLIEITDNDIIDLNNCITFSHMNFLFIMKSIINKIKDEIFETSKNKKEINNSYIYYQKCKIIIELNNEKIDDIKLKNNFFYHNKIIKNILFNLLSSHSYQNKAITDNIFKLYYLHKKHNFIYIINFKIKNDEFINEKIKSIIQEYRSPEDLSDLHSANECMAPTPPVPPFLPKKKENDLRDYCLVLDLDETLVHYFEDDNEAYVKVRLGTEIFIKELSKYCEICIFTASTKFYADTVINGLGNHNLIDYRLYRQHTDLCDGVNIKDLSKLGRNLEKIIIIDNIEKNYQLQPNNGLNISDFEGDENDNELEYLLGDLLEVVKEPGKNVINELDKVRRNMQKRYTNLS